MILNGVDMIDFILLSLGLKADKEEQRILDLLDKHALPSMRIVGNGTLTMDAIEARSTPESIAFIENIKKMKIGE